MFKRTLTLLAGLSFAASLASAQTLSPKWEDLTSADFVKAIQKAGGVCLLPMGSLEKFGPSAPIGTNVYLSRVIPLEAAKQEYAVLFPEYFVAGTGDATVQPGTIHYSPAMQMQFLDETTREMARNGCKKVILSNGHTGNVSLIQMYLANFADTPHDYSVYYIYSVGFPVNPNELAKLAPAMRPSKPGVDGHGGEERVAAMLAFYPDLIHLDRAHDEPSSSGHVAPTPGATPPPAGSLSELPNGYSGDAAGATAERGHALVDYAVEKLVTFIRSVKADNQTLMMQKQFYQHVEHPQN